VYIHVVTISYPQPASIIDQKQSTGCTNKKQSPKNYVFNKFELKFQTFCVYSHNISCKFYWNNWYCSTYTTVVHFLK